MTKLIAAVVAILLLGGCAQNAQLLTSDTKVGTEQTSRSRNLFIGRWYGDEHALDGGRHQWLNERKEDGSFVVRFRSTKANETINQTEYGSWGVSANIYFSITSGFMHGVLPEAADPTDPTLYDAYEIISLTADSMTYRSLETGNTYTAKRVDEHFAFPTD